MRISHRTPQIAQEKQHPQDHGSQQGAHGDNRRLLRTSASLCHGAPLWGGIWHNRIRYASQILILGIRNP